MKSSVISDTSSLSAYITSFITKYDKKGKKTASEILSRISAPSDFVSAVQGMIEKKTPPPEDFSKNFSKSKTEA